MTILLNPGPLPNLPRKYSSKTQDLGSSVEDGIRFRIHFRREMIEFPVNPVEFLLKPAENQLNIG